jgi:aromatic-L-amino-acid/L-tryptophan decarboxylase
MAQRPHGRAGLQALPEHVRLARAFARWVNEDPDWERLAPVPFSTVCFRLRPRGWAVDDARLNPLNERLREAVNATGAVFLSHALLPFAPASLGHRASPEAGAVESRASRYALRLAIRELRTEERDVRQAWEILRAEALRLGATPPLLA